MIRYNHWTMVVFIWFLFRKNHEILLPFFKQSEKIPSHLRRHCLESWPPPKSFIHLSSFERDWFWCSWDATRFQKLRCLPKHNWRLKPKIWDVILFIAKDLFEVEAAFKVCFFYRYQSLCDIPTSTFIWVA